MPRSVEDRPGGDNLVLDLRDERSPERLLQRRPMAAFVERPQPRIVPIRGVEDRADRVGVPVCEGPHAHAHTVSVRPSFAVSRFSAAHQIRYTRRVNPGQLLREVRKRHGLTQAQLAVRARTSQAAISRIERALVSPSVATLAQLLDLMGEELSLEAHPIDYGIDATLFDLTLSLTPEERIEAQAKASGLVSELAAAVRRANG
jgi:transcriptional regulator with XRE-family HTH domain